jgi:hypothetical protein
VDINGNSNRKAVTITHPATLDGNSRLFRKKPAKKLIMVFWEKARKKVNYGFLEKSQQNSPKQRKTFGILDQRGFQILPI